MPFYLGVDVGGTKTHALIADEQGNALGLGHAGPGNHEMVGWDGLAAVLHAAIGEATDRAGIALDQIAGAGFGVAGYDWTSEREPTLQVIQTLGLDAPVEAVNDAVLGLIAGASQGWGVSVIAGTGCNSYGRDRQGRIGRMTGEGDLMGEFAGAGQVVIAAVQSISREWSKRGPATALTPAFLALAGQTEVEAFLESVCEGQRAIDAEAARLISKVATDGDPVARGIIDWAGRQLGDLAIGVIHQLELEVEEFEVVLAGSLFEGGPLLTDPLCDTVRAIAPRAQFVRLSAPPVVGAVLLGMEQAGLRDPRLRLKLVKSIDRVMG